MQAQDGMWGDSTPADLRMRFLGLDIPQPTLAPGLLLSVPWLPGPTAVALILFVTGEVTFPLCFEGEMEVRYSFFNFSPQFSLQPCSFQDLLFLCQYYHPSFTRLHCLLFF